ncbi:MAG: hypothetical protein ACLRFK_03620 [Alphaproteobacteria bacterium]
MAQKCIFCGGEPQNKNKEHVIPQWLSKYLERYKDICDLSGVTDKKIPFCGLVFPACEKCNSDDSVLEASAKKVVEKLMESKSVTGAEINTLLDWFDKLRTGIWIGQLMLSKRIYSIDPNFYINDRIGSQDRMLIIERIEGVGKGLGLCGSNTEMFMNMPSVFQVWFNDVLITSASTAGLVSNKLGFPRIGRQQEYGYRKSVATVIKGTGKTVHPVVMNIDAVDKTIIYQPMFKNLVSQTDLYDVQYVQQHSYDASSGVGGIFVQRHNNAIRYLKPEDKVMLMPKMQPNSSTGKSMKRVFDLQNHLMTQFNDLTTYETEHKEYIKMCLVQNQLRSTMAEQTK